MKSNLRMAIIRPIGAPISTNEYNCQEIGLARGLSLCGVNVDVYVASHGSEVNCKIINSSGVGRVRLFEVPFFKIPEIDHAIYPKLLRLLKKGDYSFIQVNEENELTSFFVAHFARKSGIPVVVYQGMYEQITGRIRAAFQKIYDKFMLPTFRCNINKALVKTSRAQKHLERKGFKDISIIPVGLDSTPFSCRKDRNWRCDFSIPDESPILLYVGVFESRRNVDFMLDLARHLKNTEITLVMAGTGPDYFRIADRVKVERLNNVRLVGTVAQEAIPSLYLTSELFLLPSNYEIYGMVVIESMFFGIPVISTQTAGPEDIISNGYDGIVIDNLIITEWCDEILNLLNNKEKLNKMSKNACNKIKNTLLWDKVAIKYYNEVIYPAVHI